MENLVEISRILVLVDYSEYSISACRYALNIANKANASLAIFHAFHSPAYDLLEMTGNKSTQNRLWDEVTAKLLQVEEKNLEVFLKKVFEQKEWKGFLLSNIGKIIKPGLAKDEIQKYANEYEPNLVIMGIKGKDKRDNSILGNTTEIAIKKLKYPVLAVPHNYTFAPENTVEKMLFLTEYDESDFMSIKGLMDFARLMNLSIFCLHIGSKAGKWEKLKMSGLSNYFKSTYKDIQVDCDILTFEGNILQAIDSFINNNDISIISLTTRKRNLLEKIVKPRSTNPLPYQLNIPLLVFHS